MAASNESLQTPQRDSILRVPATEERAHFFWHVDNRRDGEAMQDVTDAHGIHKLLHTVG
jgi:hypothetical protein